MAEKVVTCHLLPDEAKAVIWRVFGGGSSPLNRLTAYELIRPVIKKHATSADLDTVTAEVRGWFQSHAGQQYLRDEMREPVAVLIVHGVASERGETAIWAIGSIAADLAADLIRCRWGAAEIDSFVEATLTVLGKFCKRDDVVDARHRTGIGEQVSASAYVPKSGFERPGKLETFSHLERHAYELVYYGLHPAVGNLLELVLALRPGMFPLLVERLDHPVMQARAALRVVGAVRRLDHRSTLSWISEDSCDDLIALGILQTLHTIISLDEENRHGERMNVEQHNWSTELRPSLDDLDAAAGDILTGLVDRLAVLDPLRGVRWIGELLSHAPYVLNASDDGEVPQRIEQLERACAQRLVNLVCQSWSEDLIEGLCTGLRLTPRPTWSRHLAEVAWQLRKIEPARAAEIARLTLDEHQRYIDERLKQDDRLFLHWNDWQQRQWFGGLGVLLVLAYEELHLLEWISERCRPLALSVWDGEERLEAFSAADRAAQHWFLVALHALPRLEELGRTADPDAVCALVEKLWAHCRFVELYLFSRPDTAVVVELGAHCAAEFGRPSDSWLLEQARDPSVGPCALRVLVERRLLGSTRADGLKAHYEETITDELRRITSERFGDGGQFTLEELRCWGELWFLLGTIDEAEQTAMLIFACPHAELGNAAKISALKLFALVANKRGLSPTLEDCIAFLYGELWPAYTSEEKCPDRLQIDELLEQPGTKGP